MIVEGRILQTIRIINILQMISPRCCQFIAIRRKIQKLILIIFILILLRALLMLMNRILRTIQNISLLLLDRPRVLQIIISLKNRI